MRKVYNLATAPVVLWYQIKRPDDMSLVKKTILVIIIITLVLITVIYFLTEYVFLAGFEDAERKAVEDNSRKLSASLVLKQRTIEAFSYDWAEWDDTYEFLTDHNEEYISNNLLDSTFITNDVNVMLFIDTQGKLVHGKAVDFNLMQEIPLPMDTKEYITKTILPNVAVSGYGISGITSFSGQPMLTSVRIALTSTNQGPSTGYLLVGRFVDDRLISTFSDTLGFTVNWLPLSGSVSSNKAVEIIDLVREPGKILVEPVNDDTILGYFLVRDIMRNPAFVFQLSMQRTIREQGLRTLRFAHASLLVIAVVSCIIIYYVFRYLILGRLSALSHSVSSIGVKGEITNRVQVKGHDELSKLANNINSMLDSLEKSEARRESQKEIIGHIIANTPNGVVALNESGQIVIINDAFRNMFNLKNVSFSNNKLEDLPDITDIAIEINNFRLSRMPSFRKEIMRMRQGVAKIYIASFARLKEEELYILYLTDISEERAKQESLYLTDRLASIGEMASGIAHELNNPLTSIIGLSEIVMRDNVPEDVKEDMGLIKSESHRAAGIVRNLLSFARKNATIKQPTNINAIIDDVLRLRSYEHGVNNIKIIKDLDMELPDILVDHSQIQQVFINIVLNAEYAMISAHGKGNIVIKTEAVDGILKISFADDGPGIEPGNLRHIFDPFFTTKEVGKGTGLGLSISYGIVTAHNGRIYAASEPGKGATFYIELPLHNSATKEARPDAR
jgi:signal transduction histidine kinase/sensor domain CHASE-containing protein